MRILQALLILIILGLQVRLWIGPGSLSEIDQIEVAISTQETENVSLEARNQSLLTEVEELKNGTDGIEEMAREDLGLIKEGETFYMIVEPEKPGKPDGAEQE
jgi:cell division protein FtsB